MVQVHPHCEECNALMKRYVFGKELGWTCVSCQTTIPDDLGELTVSAIEISNPGDCGEHCKGVRE